MLSLLLAKQNEQVPHESGPIELEYRGFERSTDASTIRFVRVRKPEPCAVLLYIGGANRMVMP